MTVLAVSLFAALGGALGVLVPRLVARAALRRRIDAAREHERSRRRDTALRAMQSHDSTVHAAGVALLAALDGPRQR